MLNRQEVFAFLVGFVISVLLVLNLYSSYAPRPSKLSAKINQPALKSQEKEIVNNGTYESKLADQLYHDIRILCWVFTHPSNHKLKVPHVENTWGKRCNKLLFMSIESVPDHPEIIAIPVPEGRSHLWNKTRLAMKYVYEHHFSDADWFMRADDDK